mmetsp:Transcript_42344/g.61853  ORF Transcript_42344/g.61853 Transcript_42344/m.61853 type:complete len:468 (-) Transcript_42344:240-1643(-)
MKYKKDWKNSPGFVKKVFTGNGILAKKTADWEYIELHASPRLRVIIERKKTKSTNHRNFYHYLDLKNPSFRDKFRQKRMEVCEQLQKGYFRTGTAPSLQNVREDTISPPSPQPAITEKMRLRIDELARLCEESKMGKPMGSRANWDYIERNASPALRELINRKKENKKILSHRNFSLYLCLQNPNIKEAFETRRNEIREEIRRKYQVGVDFSIIPPPMLLPKKHSDHDYDNDTEITEEHNFSSLKRFSSEISSSSAMDLSDNEGGEEKRMFKKRKLVDSERVYVCSSRPLPKQSSEENTESADFREWQPARLLRIEKTEQNQLRYTVKLDCSCKHGRIHNDELILSEREYDQGMRSRKRAEDGTFINKPDFSMAISSSEIEDLSLIISSSKDLNYYGEENIGEAFFEDKEGASRQTLSSLMQELKRLREEYVEEEKRHARRQEAHQSRMIHYEESLLTLLPSDDDLP